MYKSCSWEIELFSTHKKCFQATPLIPGYNIVQNNVQGIAHSLIKRVHKISTNRLQSSVNQWKIQDGVMKSCVSLSTQQKNEVNGNLSWFGEKRREWQRKKWLTKATNWWEHLAYLKVLNGRIHVEPQIPYPPS